MPGYSDIAKRSPTTGTRSASANPRSTSAGAGARVASPGASAWRFGGGGSTTPQQQRRPGGFSTSSSTTPTGRTNTAPGARRAPTSTYPHGATSRQQPQQQQQQRRTQAFQQASTLMNGSRGGGGSSRGSSSRADSISADLFNSKLAEMSDVREQIERLAKKHRDNEQSLADLVQGIVAMDETHREKTKQELLSIVTERDNTIQMLEVFRQEGNTIIRRLHENLRNQVAQNEATLRQLHQSQRENAALRSGSDGADMSASRESVGSAAGSGIGVGGVGGELEDLRRRCVEYSQMLGETDNVAAAMKARVEQLMKQLTDAGITPAPPDEAQLKRMEGSVDDLDDSSTLGSTPTAAGGSGAGAAGSSLSIDDLRERLRHERRMRLEAEEKSHQVFLQQQKQIRLLEQRLTNMQARQDRGSAQLTPRSSAPPSRPHDAVSTPSHQVQPAPSSSSAVGASSPQQDSPHVASPSSASSPSINVKQHQQQPQPQPQQQSQPASSSSDDPSANIFSNPASNDTAAPASRDSAAAAAPPPSPPNPSLGKVSISVTSDKGTTSPGKVAPPATTGNGGNSGGGSGSKGRSSRDSPTGNPEEDTQMLEDIERQLQHVYMSLEQSE